MTRLKFELIEPAADTVVHDARHLQQLAFRIAWARLLGTMVVEPPAGREDEYREALKILGARVDD